MNLDDYRLLFIITGAILTLLATIPLLTLVALPPGGEGISELWLLGPNHTGSGLPSVVTANTAYRVHVVVANHLGETAHYALYVKFSNQTSRSATNGASVPTVHPPLYQFDFFLLAGEIWEAPLSFTVGNVSFHSDSATVSSILINDIPFPLTCTALWNAAREGYPYQLLVELWRQPPSSTRFHYQNSTVSLALTLRDVVPVSIL